MSLLHQQNTNCKLVIFDFDGTIADTSEGILDSHKYTLSLLGVKEPTEEELLKLIGGQLLKIYMDTFGFSQQEAKNALQIYRSRYASKGIEYAALYTGIEELMEELKADGYYIGVATLKAEIFAKKMIDNLKIKNKIDVIFGMDENDTLTKTELIEKCMNVCSVTKDYTVMVGDSSNDYDAAQKAGVEFIGVTYGFGYKKDINYPFKTANDSKEILRYLKRCL